MGTYDHRGGGEGGDAAAVAVAAAVALIMLQTARQKCIETETAAT